MTDSTITTALPYARRADLDSSVWYFGHLFSFLAEAVDTRGTLAVLEILGRRGLEPPMHIQHRDDEAFYVLEGEMTFYLGDEARQAPPGTFVFVPRGVAHSFRIRTETSRMLAFLWPARAEAQFRLMGEPALAMTLPPLPEDEPDVERMIALMAEYGEEVVEPLPEE